MTYDLRKGFSKAKSQAEGKVTYELDTVAYNINDFIYLVKYLVSLC